MPRLIDDLRAPDAKVAMPNIVASRLEQAWTSYAATVNEILHDEFPILLIDNVADYYFQASDQEYWDLSRDFPNLAPPYVRFWCEHKLPKTIHSKQKGDTQVSELVPSGRVGILITALDPKECKGDGIPVEARWILWADIFIDFGRRDCAADGPHCPIFLAIDAEGRLLGEPHAQSYSEPELGEIVRSLMTWLHPALLAISFLHCKNVAIVENEAPAKLAKRHRERHGVTPCRYKTLIIEPLKQILRREGGSDKVGIQRALHICRGHFKDYRQGAGLFGRYHKLIWQPSIVRGTKGEKAPPREAEIRLPKEAL